ANKAKQSEARTYVGSMNRAQQAYFLENDQFLIDEKDFGQLGLGIATETKNYSYGVVAKGNNVSNYADLNNTDSALRAYQGAVIVGTLTDTSEVTTLAVLCEAETVVRLQGPQGSEPDIKIVDEQPDCQDGWKKL
ncbi:MAG: general secretion pathway protein GspH, partial [Moorea sp. SIO3C2]|nr:general secretion pathway protein GspH [Moorena sp. SIO3C2]